MKINENKYFESLHLIRLNVIIYEFKMSGASDRGCKQISQRFIKWRYSFSQISLVF